MVSSQTSSLTAAFAQGPKLFTAKILLPMGPPDVVSSENVEYDFSDVFGPTPVQTPTDLCVIGPDSPARLIESNEEVYNDPVVIIKRSHSLVGPTSLVSRSLRLSKLTLNKTEGSSELVGCPSEEKERNLGQLSDEEFDNATNENEGVGLDDFEILKLVGQGAFGKVFQVRKKGTSEIYAMKVMRKDKILENNHAEFMKAERDILKRYAEYMKAEREISEKPAILCTFQLLHKEAGKRLGSGPGGSDGIKKHKWFKPINWRKLEARQIQPSFRPNVTGLTCIANFDECWTSMPVLDSPVATPVTAGGGQSSFAGFTYVRPAPFLHEVKPSTSRLKESLV